MTKPFVIKKFGIFSYYIIRDNNKKKLHISRLFISKDALIEHLKETVKVFHDWSYNLTGDIDIAIEDATIKTKKA